VIGTNTATYVRGGSYGSQNFGNSADLWVKKSPNTSSNTRETYLKFDLSSVSTISSAKLQLVGRLSDTQNSSVGIRVYALNNRLQNWTETGLTNSNKPATSSTIRGSATITGLSNSTYQIDLTTFLKAEKAAGRNIVTLVIKGTTSTNSGAIFASDETASGPKLIINT
jgi:endoglucanase